MGNSVLTKQQIEQFIECGYVRVEEAFPRMHALNAQQYLWHRLEEKGISQADSSTWVEPMIHLQELYDDDVFQQCNTDRLAEAVAEIVGQHNLLNYTPPGQPRDKTDWGWWPINFSLGSNEPWTVPTGGWHWDGIHFKHYVDSPEQGLLCLTLFSDIATRGGGTLVAEGSHKVVAQLLNRFPDGLELGDAVRELVHSHPWFGELVGVTNNISQGARIEYFMEQVHTDAANDQLRIVETTGKAGDVYLCHPFLFHAASQNHNRIPRFMCNRTSPLKQRMNLTGASGNDQSPLERSIANVL